MSAIGTISVENLLRLAGTPKCPAIVDVEPDDDCADPRIVPTAVRRSYASVADWASEFKGTRVVVACTDGRTYSPGVAAWLRQTGIAAETIDGGTRPGLPRDFPC